MCRIEGQMCRGARKKLEQSQKCLARFVPLLTAKRVLRFAQGDNAGEGMGDQQIRIRISGARLERSGRLGR